MACRGLLLCPNGLRTTGTAARRTGGKTRHASGVFSTKGERGTEGRQGREQRHGRQGDYIRESESNRDRAPRTDRGIVTAARNNRFSGTHRTPTTGPARPSRPQGRKPPRPGDAELTPPPNTQFHKANHTPHSTPGGTPDLRLRPPRCHSAEETVRDTKFFC